jgi:hypothetical protein
MANQQLDATRTKQRYIVDNTALQTQLNELQVSRSVHVAEGNGI